MYHPRSIAVPYQRGLPLLVMTFRLSKADRRAMGDRLKAARNLAGYSARSAALEVPCSTTSIVEWEAGRVLPRPETRARLAELYGVDEARLFAEELARVESMRELIADSA